MDSNPREVGTGMMEVKWRSTLGRGRRSLLLPAILANSILPCGVHAGIGVMHGKDLRFASAGSRGADVQDSRMGASPCRGRLTNGGRI
jgi:hypothetical protein